MSPSENTSTSVASSSKSSSFQYEPLTGRESEIRLRILPASQQSKDVAKAETFDIHCQIFHSTLDQAPIYKALSYTWGSPDDPQLLIKLNQQTFSVRENLWRALQQLHAQSDPIVIWIDAVCINQTDETERNEQVTKMKTIYEKAEEVVVWLGQATRTVIWRSN
ncbi:hypothetical protein ACEPPN_009176 [Leptodophora sp. 'Broadleaf-Isolate-01']